MEPTPLTIKLRCTSWGQLDAIYRRDLMRSAVFLKTTKPPPIGTGVRINLTLPSQTLIILSGAITVHVPEGGLDGRGPGVDIGLHTVPQSAMWLIESALTSAGKKEASAARTLPPAATERAIGQRRAPPDTSRADASLSKVIDAGLEDGRPVLEAEAELLEALLQELIALSKRNPFQILGVGYDATDQDVRTAFARLTKKYHPDRFARYESRDLRDQASEVYILIRDAYRRIGSPRAREQALEALHGKSPRPARADRTQRMGSVTGPTPQPVPRAATPPPLAPPGIDRTQQIGTLGGPPPLPPPPTPGLSGADLFTGQGDSPAAGTGASAVEVNAPPGRGNEVDRADVLVDQGHHREALKIYKMLWHRNQNDLRARAGVELCEGLTALAEQDRLEAAQRFEVVLELDPENEVAARELSEMRRQATQDRKGLLARLLGKKE
ncbi:MAG TPA: J domain-containing protein [Kofleriaceae bacterium]|nr:J domain-containing protein [Kofleriaceae bacterium]